MNTIHEDILKIADKACLKILADNKVVTIKHMFHIGNKSTLGVTFLLLGGIFFIAAPFIKTSDNTSKVIGIVLGLSLLTLSILTIVRQINDGLEIKDNILIFRYNLKQVSLPLDHIKRITMKTEIIKIKRAGTLGSVFIDITHFIQHQNKETPVLKFQMNNTEADNAKKLGNELTRIMNAAIRQ